MTDLSSLIERIEGRNGRRLPPYALATLPFVPGYPGSTWFSIVEAAPKNRRGHTVPFRHTIRPLLELGLIAKNQPPRDDEGRLPFSLYHITPLGREVLKAKGVSHGN